mmetsp:Transcript_18225/g.33487  ORF Transcript_18225/g.33487 Transcript_18225/m.33487 type:complete len:450 (+) Transcript_18225:1031-2380(+)
MALQDNTIDHPQTSKPQACTPKHRLNKDGCLLQPANVLGCPVACGSPGEVANVGGEGHQFSMITKDRLSQNSADPDKNFDHEHGTRMPDQLVKTTIWTMKAMQANDQLRQRTAWALSQIIVIGLPGLMSEDKYTEAMINFYDIFVRHAFGSFRSILQEVTYSPLMGRYLTYHQSKSYARSKSYPDENYAREIMQLFSIGVHKLHPNGSAVLDRNLVAVPAYTNDNIMSFARVLTGFQQQELRGNIEVGNRAVFNSIDPMKMIVDWHDTYPKPDLKGNYLGDGYPLCSDLPNKAFLAKGAKYEFLGYSFQGDVYTPPQSSGLYQTLSKSDLIVKLEEDLACEGEECSFQTISVVKVRNAFYEYVAPSCVHLFLYNGQTVRSSERARVTKCVDPDTPVAEFACCSGCTDNPTGWMRRRSMTCENSEELLASKCNKAPTGDPKKSASILVGK